MPDLPQVPRFCTECGSPLPPDAKFCSHCGTRAAAPSPKGAAEAPQAPSAPTIPAELKAKYDRARDELRGERREVAVLFADLKGFTAMSERLDPDEVTLLMNILLQALAGAVYDYEGYVDKFMGDAIMALFGAPLAHENDAERSVLAGLSMLSVIRNFNETAETPLAIRVGINLGEVVAAHLGSESKLQYTVMGDTVNVASRLKSAAALDSVLVSAAVHDRIGARFETEAVAPLTVKGKAEPLRTFRVVRYRPSMPRRSQTSTRFVGRDSELTALESFFGRIPGGDAGALVIEAEAGAGKSRLVEEALTRTRVELSAFEIGFSQIQLPGRLPASAELLRQIVSEGEPPTGAAAMVDRTLALLGGEAEQHRSGVEEVVRQLLPASEIGAAQQVDPAVARQNRWLAVAALLSARAGAGPVLLRLEDAHWADESDEEFLALLVPSLPGRPVGIIATARPGSALAWAPANAERLSLRNLDEGAARSILGGLFETLEPNVRKELIRRSQGNPLYLEELARSLRDAVETTAASVPGTVQGLLQSHIDRLPPAVRLLLQMASILGTPFSVALLERMYGLDPQPIPFEPAFERLAREGLVETLPSAEDSRFRHALMQEVAYGSILFRLKKVLHESAAELGEEHFADRLEAEAPFFAHHYWEAGLLPKAAPHLWSAGRAAARNFELHAAERFFQRLAEAIENHPQVLPDSEDRADLMATYGTVLKERARFEDAVAWFERLQELGELDKREEWVAKALYNRGVIAWYRGQFDDASALFEIGLSRVPPDNDRITADLHSGLGLVHMYRGQAEESLAQHEQALRLRQRIDDRFGIVKSLINIGNVLSDLQDDLPRAQENYEHALDLARENGDREMQCGLLLNIGSLDLDRGEYESALRRLDDVQEVAEEVGFSFIRFLGLRNQAICYVRLGRIQPALQTLRTCLREGENVLEPVNRVAARILLFEAHLSALDAERASEWLREARALAERLDVTEHEDWLRMSEGRRLAAQGDWREAASAFAEASAAAMRLQNPVSEKIARAHHGRALARAGLERIETSPPEAEGRRSLIALLRYLWADGAAAGGASRDVASALAEAGELAARIGDVSLERAAFERQAEVLRQLGDESGERTAGARAAQAMWELMSRLPEELRDGFAAHPRNAALSDLFDTAQV
jgi:adenylate cyclase